MAKQTTTPSTKKKVALNTLPADCRQKSYRRRIRTLPGGLTHASTRLNWLPRMKSRSRTTSPMITTTSIRISVVHCRHWKRFRCAGSPASSVIGVARSEASPLGPGVHDELGVARTWVGANVQIVFGHALTARHSKALSPGPRCGRWK